MTVIYHNGKTVGQMQFEKQGLYYEVSCRCKYPLEKALRVFAVCNGEKIPLGLCVPEGAYFTMRYHIPATRFSGEIERCELWENQSENVYIPLDPNAPFPYIRLLEKARFCTLDGKPHLALPQELLLTVGVKDGKLLP